MIELEAKVEIDWEKMDGLLPAIIQDANSRAVLMMGYMNAEALQKTQESGKVTFFSRSKQRLWTKGETSGNFMHVKSIHLDCDGDTLKVVAQPVGPVCHTGADTCFFEANTPNAAFLHQLETIIIDRKQNPDPKSHTSQMFEKGLNAIAQKFGEEAVEALIEAKDDNRELMVNEVSDLLYRLTTLLVAKEIPLHEVMACLQQRHQAEKLSRVKLMTLGLQARAHLFSS